MISTRFVLVGGIFSLILATFPVQADTFYVSPNGSDASDCPGTEAAPFASLNRAQEVVSPGDTVFIRGGTYVFSGTQSDIGVIFSKSGSPGSRINYWAYDGEIPIFDFFGLTPQARIRGFSIRASFLHFRGLELTGVQQILTNVNESWCIRVENGASDNIFEQLNLHHNEGPGLFIADGGNNQVVNVDSHHNYDPDRGGENADGFGCHSDDPGNTFSGCRAWYNSDDGFDFINSPGVCTVENSWAFYNGFIPDTSTGAGNGAGIKAGGFGLDSSRFPPVVPRHVVRFNLAFGNRSQGFYANHHPGGIDWFNNTAFNNPRNFDMLADLGSANHLLRNNLAAGSGENLARATASEIDDSYNSWSVSVTVSDADFLSVSDVGVDSPRSSDGSLPNTDFLKLRENSDLIDVGVDIGFPYVDEAPDLGAFEFGASSASGSGGTSGSGGEAGGAIAGSGGTTLVDAGVYDGGGQGGTGGEPNTSETGGVIAGEGGAGTSGASDSIEGNNGSPSPETGSTGGFIITNTDTSPTQENSASNSGCSCQIGADKDKRHIFLPLLLLAIGIRLHQRRFGSGSNRRYRRNRKGGSYSII